MDFIDLFHNSHSFNHHLVSSQELTRAQVEEFALHPFARVLNTRTQNGTNFSSKLAAKPTSVTSLSVDDLYLRYWEIFGLPITIVLGLLNNFLILLVMPRTSVSAPC